MPCLFESPLHLNSFMEGSVVHDDGLPRSQFGKQDFLGPRLEKRCIAGAIKSHGGQDAASTLSGHKALARKTTS
jgi:hypothetical protein